MIPIVLFFGLCFLGFGDCDKTESTLFISEPCPYDFTNWHQYREIKQCVVVDNILFEKYNRTELPKRIVFDDQIFKFGVGREGGSDLEDQIKWFQHKELGKKLGLDYNKTYYLTVHNRQNDLVDIKIFVDDPVWQEYTGYDTLWFYQENDWEKTYMSLSVANTTTVKITIKDPKYRIVDDKTYSVNSKIGEWHDDGVFWSKFNGQPSDVYVDVAIEPNPYWQSVKYILNEKFDCGILVTFADGTQQMRKEIPDLGSKTITIIENPQFRDSVCSGQLQNSKSVNEERKD